MNFINFDLGWIFKLSAGCLFHVGIHGRLLIATIGPIIAAVFLGFTYVLAEARSRGSTDAMQVIRHRHVSMGLLLTFLVYSSVSSIIFQMFACDDVADGMKYLRADYGVECDSPNHRSFQIYAGFMMLLYTVGIPALYTGLLVQNRSVLKDDVGREENQSTRSFSDLWKPYKPSVFYYEVIECGRRVLLTGAVVFNNPNTSAQIAATLVIAVFFGMVSEGLAPFASRWDTWINRMGHVVVYVSMYVALLLEVDVSDERSSSQKVFEVFLVAANLGLILAVIVESGVIVCSLRQTVKEGISPRFRGTSFPFTRGIVPEEVVGPISRCDGVGCANKAIHYPPWYA